MNAIIKKPVKPEISFERVNEIIEYHNFEKSKLIPILQGVQEHYKYLPQEILVYIAYQLKISQAKVYSVATFYSYFSLTPKGKYVIKVCDGTACHVKGSNKLIGIIKDHLKLTGKNMTTDDMLFTLETVSCLGACGLAPVVVVNDDVHGLMDKTKTEALLDKIKEKETTESQEEK